MRFIPINGSVTGSMSALLVALGLLSGCAGQPSTVIRFNEENAQEIINGDKVRIVDRLQPHVVGIFHYEPEKTDPRTGETTEGKGFICTGSILSENLVLTAAHCVLGDPKFTVLRFGPNINSETVLVRKVSDYVTSPLWGKRRSKSRDTGDIALIRFEGGLPAGYRPVEILELEDAFVLRDGVPVTVAGYGLFVSKGKKQEGAGVLRKTDLRIESTYSAETEIVLDQSKGAGTCFGDSGGPAYVQVGKKVFLWGIASRVFSNRRDERRDEVCSQYSLYTNILAYRDWINASALKLLTKQASPANGGETLAANE